MIYNITYIIISAGFGIFVGYSLFDVPVFGIPLGIICGILASVFLYDWLEHI